LNYTADKGLALLVLEPLLEIRLK